MRNILRRVVGQRGNTVERRPEGGESKGCIPPSERVEERIGSGFSAVFFDRSHLFAPNLHDAQHTAGFFTN